jgi:hypothetical protein
MQGNGESDRAEDGALRHPRNTGTSLNREMHSFAFKKLTHACSS